MMHHAAAEDDLLRWSDGEDIETGLREVVGLKSPGGMIGSEIFGGSFPAVLNGGSGGESFETVVMKGAISREVIIGISLETHVAHFGMPGSVNEMTIDHDGPSDAGANSEIGGVFETLGSSPSRFTEKSRINVGVEDGGNAEGFLERSEEVGVGPTGFWGVGNVSVGGGVRIKIGGTEGADGEGFGLAELRRSLFEESDKCGDCFLRRGGGNAFAREDVIGARSESGDHFGPSGFERGDEWGVHGVRSSRINIVSPRLSPV